MPRSLRRAPCKCCAICCGAARASCSRRCSTPTPAVYLLRLADDALVPVAPGMRSLNQVQVLGDKLLVHTDLDAPRGCAPTLDMLRLSSAISEYGSPDDPSEGAYLAGYSPYHNVRAIGI